MSAAEMIVPAISSHPSWAEISERYPNEWVCMTDVEHQPDGRIRYARVVGHHRSLRAALQQIDSWNPERPIAYAHTGGRPLRRPRIEMTDEIRDIIRTQR